MVRGPEQNNTDLTLSRIFKLGSSEKRTLDFRGEFFNAFNHVQYADPAVAYGTASFGSIQSTSVAPRIIQLAAKIQFCAHGHSRPSLPANARASPPEVNKIAVRSSY